MAASFKIIDGTGTRSRAKVTKIGQVVTAPFAYDDSSVRELAEPDTAYNFYGPRSGEQFVMTGIFAKADRDVSNTVDAIVVLYEASGPSETDVDKVLFQAAMVRGDQVIVNPLNVLVGEGKWLNGKTTDDDIHANITGYYVPALG